MGSLFASAGLRSAAGNRTIWDPPANQPGPAPTPDNFVVQTVKPVGDLFVSLIVYPGCTNFEGKKVLVTEWDPRSRRILDPHFLPGNGILARFEPTLRGLRWAEKFASLLNDLHDGSYAR